MKFIRNLLNSIENLVSKGDKYYGKLLIATNMLNAVYLIMFSFFSISLIQNQLLRSINTGIQIFVCVLLFIKFHPFREHTLGQSDSNLIFSAATFLMINLGIIEMLNRFKHNLTGKIHLNENTVDGYIDNINEQMSNLNEQLDNLHQYMDKEGFEGGDEGFDDGDEGFNDGEEGFEGYYQEGLDEEDDKKEGLDEEDDKKEGLDEEDNKKEGLEDGYQPYM